MNLRNLNKNDGLMPKASFDLKESEKQVRDIFGRRILRKEEVSLKNWKPVAPSMDGKRILKLKTYLTRVFGG
ncbi:MAG: hypothetical protein IPM97_08235 [Bdellovibrionaceae bacterium]|nr:hypothetical protein [Pseudobdellovibrionaceae bacterium]